MPSDSEQRRLADTITRERGPVTRLARTRLARFPELDPEDVVSDVVLRLFERADLLAEVENLTAYLFQAVGNRLTDLLRRRRRVEELFPDLIIDPAPDPEQRAEGQEWRRQLEAALDQLSAPERAVWLAVEVEGHSFRELADDWSEPIGTLLSRKARAEKKLRQLLGNSR